MISVPGRPKAIDTNPKIIPAKRRSCPRKGSTQKIVSRRGPRRCITSGTETECEAANGRIRDITASHSVSVPEVMHRLFGELGGKEPARFWIDDADVTHE